MHVLLFNHPSVVALWLLPLTTMDVQRPISRHRTIILPLTHLVRHLFLQTFQQIIHIRTGEGNTEGGEVGVVIVGGPKEVGEGTGLLGGKGASCHCDAAKHGTGIKMRKGPQIVDRADLGSTAMENPLPNLLAACVHLIWQEVPGGGFRGKGGPPKSRMKEA